MVHRVDDINTDPAKDRLIFADVEQNLECACRTVHAVVNPLVNSKQSRLFFY